MRKLILLAVLAAISTLSAMTFAPMASAHGCHNYCAWVWLGDGGGAWCGADHDGEIYYRWDGLGFKCHWEWDPDGHYAYWTSGWG